MNKLYLSWIIHNHQPVGNFDFVLEEAYEHAYEPFVAALERHPAVRVTLHWSGSLRDWLKQHRPDFLARVRALVGRKQIEPLGGGYYEPVLVALPDADKVGQLVKLSQALELDFGVRAKGAWLAERVWEPHLPRILAESGLEYTLLDDTHFLQAGLSLDDLQGYYITEEQGYTQTVFASLQALRNLMPWSPVDQVIHRLRELANRPGAEESTRFVAVGDDGEKFGLWPGTHTVCWGDDEANGWIEAFFTALEQNAEWLTLITLDDATRLMPPLGRIYLPASSYDEMMEWSLPVPRAQELSALKRQLQTVGLGDAVRYMRAGTWRSFMAKYPEVNTLHKKMVRVSHKVHQIKKSKTRAEALDRLWASQCNCPFWHGVFGGVYLFHIREAAARHLIAAEALADRAAHAGESWAEAAMADADCDGLDEALLSSDAQSLIVSPGRGGVLIGWDWRASGVNLLNVLSRRPEAYHRTLSEAAANGTLVVAGQPAAFGPPSQSIVRAKESGLEQKLIYDRYRRASLVDHVFSAEETLDAFYHASLDELGDFIEQPYAAKVSKSRGDAVLSLARRGRVRMNGEAHMLHVEKKIHLKPGESGLSVTYRVMNAGDEPIAARFGVETNWGMSGGDSSQGTYTVWPGGTLKRLNAISETANVREAAVVREDVGRIVIRASEPGTWWQFPIETVSNSEAGFERVYQGTALLSHWPIDLQPGGLWKLSLTFALVPASD